MTSQTLHRATIALHTAWNQVTHPKVFNWTIEPLRPKFTSATRLLAAPWSDFLKTLPIYTFFFPAQKGVFSRTVNIVCSTRSHPFISHPTEGAIANSTACDVGALSRCVGQHYQWAAGRGRFLSEATRRETCRGQGSIQVTLDRLFDSKPL